MKTYISTQPFYDGATYYKAGEPFVTDLDKKEEWTLVKPKDVAAVTAATEPVPDDANLSAASRDALQAVAIMKHVNIAGLDKPALITAIKAAYEPKL